MKKFYVIAALLASVLGSATAAKVDGAPSPISACEGLKVATGPEGKGYSKLFANIKKLAGDRIALCEVHTEGGLDNLTTISEKRADVAFATPDAMKVLSVSDRNIASLQVVATLNSNYLHVIVPTRGLKIQGEKKLGGLLTGDDRFIPLRKLSDLRGAKVAVVGSAQLMVPKLNDELGLQMKIVEVKEDVDAIKLVQNGTVAASFSVAGWPHGVLKKLDLTAGVTIVPYDVNTPKSPFYSVNPISYKTLGVYNVNALTVQNLLVTRPFSGTKVEEVAKLKAILAQGLAELKDGEYEPAWNEIDSLDTKVEWPKFQGRAAQPVAQKNSRK